jgi:hypothetical protein
MHSLQAINSDISVLTVCNKTGGTIKGDIKKKIIISNGLRLFSKQYLSRRYIVFIGSGTDNIIWPQIWVSCVLQYIHQTRISCTLNVACAFCLRDLWRISGCLEWILIKLRPSCAVLTRTLHAYTVFGHPQYFCVYVCVFWYALCMFERSYLWCAEPHCWA